MLWRWFGVSGTGNGEGGRNLEEGHVLILPSNMTTNQKIRGPCQKTIKYQGA